MTYFYHDHVFFNVIPQMELIWIWRCRDVEPYSALFNVMWESNDIKVCLKIQLLICLTI